MVGESQPEHNLTLGNRARSTTATCKPARVRKRAQVLPAGPPPTTITSRTNIVRNLAHAGRIPSDMAKFGARVRSGRPTPWQRRAGILSADCSRRASPCRPAIPRLLPEPPRCHGKSRRCVGRRHPRDNARARNAPPPAPCARRAWLASRVRTAAATANGWLGPLAKRFRLPGHSRWVPCQEQR